MRLLSSIRYVVASCSLLLLAITGVSNLDASDIVFSDGFEALPPVANNDAYSTPQDTELDVSAPGILANDSDPEGQELTVTITAQPAHGQLTLGAGGAFSYAPASGFFGSDSFRYTVSDGDLDSSEATVEITVNSPPVANNDAYSTPQDTELDVPAPGVLANDSDPEGQELTVTIIAPPAHGLLSPGAGGGFSYTPNSGYVGTDTFTYVVNDGALDSNTATVQLTINKVNLPPVANNDAYALPQDTVLNVAAPGVLANDSDPEGHALTVTIIAQPTQGHLSPGAGGVFTYTPDAGYVGTDTFTYVVNDGALDSNTATVQLTINEVNQPPLANNDAYATPQDTVLNVVAPGVLANDSDPERHALTVTITDQPDHGLLSLGTGGSFSYTPDSGYFGTDSFTYVVNDGALVSNTATVQLTIDEVNLPPVANNDAYALPQDTVLSVPAPAILANDSDPEGHALTVTITTQPTHGHLSPGAGGGFTYTPNSGYVGTDTFTYVVNDGALDSNTATVQLTINKVNLPPVANNDAYALPQDTVLNVAAPGVLANDSDPEGHALTVTIIAQPTQGHLSPGAGGVFTYTPDAGYVGTDTFTYVVNDGALDSNTATVQLTINEVNLPPLANNDAYATPQDTVLNVVAPGVLANDSDPERHALTVTITDQPDHGLLSLGTGGSFSYTPDSGYFGTDSFTYVVNDGALVSNTATVQLTIDEVNLPPVANNDAYALPQDTVLSVPAPAILANDSDPEGHALTVTITTQPTHGHLSPGAGGGFTYTPNSGYVGTDTFTYVVNDGLTDSSEATVQLTIAEVNLPPVAIGDAYTTPQDTVLSVAAPGVLANDSDPEGHALTATITTQPAHGHLSPGAGGGFSYKPDSGYFGTDTFTYVVNDGALDSNTATVQLTIDEVNLPPVANNDAYATPQDTVLNVAAPGVLANDSDPEGHALTVTITTQPTHGHLSPGAGGGFSYTPDAGYFGSDSFGYTANDGALDSNEATAEITVNEVNLPPVARDDAYATRPDMVLNVAAPGVLANDSDPEGHALTAYTTQPAHGHLSPRAGGGFSYTPDAGYRGSDTFTYTVSDGRSVSNIATVRITVDDIDLCPDEPQKTEPGACGCDMPETTACLVYGGKTRDPLTQWRLAIILIDFSDTEKSIRSKYPTPRQIEKTFFSTRSLISEYFTDMSHGHLTALEGDVFGPFTHPRTLQDLVDSGDHGSEDYSQDHLLNTGSAIQIPGFSAQDYDMIYVVSYDDYSWTPGGLTGRWNFTINDQVIKYLGTVQALQIGPHHRSPQGAFTNIYTTPHSGTIFSPEGNKGGEIGLVHTGHDMTKFERTSAHEIVHAMGLGTHANSSLGDGFPLAKPPETKSSKFETEDYGDDFGLMGRSNFSVSMVAAYRNFLGWYDNTIKTTFASIGTHRVTLYPSSAATGVRAVEIRLPYRVSKFYWPPVNRLNDGYFLEVRDPAYKWDSALAHPEILENTKGVLVTFNDGLTSWLLDMSPSPYLFFEWGGPLPDKRDMVLKPGMTFESPDVRIACTGMSADGGYEVEVEILGTW